MEEKQNTSSKAHALVVPYPSQGHINPMLQFCKRLVSKGLKATLANTVYMSKSVDLNSVSNITLKTISDGFDEGGYRQAENTEIYYSTFRVVGSNSLADLIRDINDNSDEPVSVVIYDAFLTWALDVAKQFGLIGMVFFTQSCAVSNVYYHVHKGVLTSPLSGPVVSLPGMPEMKASQAPSFVFEPDRFPVWGDVLVGQFSNIDEADWVIHNSFYKLEEEVINCLAKRWKLRTIGPTVPSKYLDKRIDDDQDYSISLFKPNNDAYMTWLNTKPMGSVVYMSFGSLAELGEEQMAELAWGLKLSNRNFLWVVRESEQSKLPQNFIQETSELGTVVSWCNQLQVLEHEAIGCFVTHCGFNSVVEALSLGVPMVAVPYWSDQPTNAKYVEDVWKVGVRAEPDENGIVRRQVLEVYIAEVMEGDKGKEIKENAANWKKLAKEAVDEGGSSDKNIDELMANIINISSIT